MRLATIIDSAGRVIGTVQHQTQTVAEETVHFLGERLIDAG